MQQIFVFVTHNILDEENSPEGFFLLQCLRQHMIVNMYTSLEVQTESTMQKGQEELLKFSNMIQVYITSCCYYYCPSLIVFLKKFAELSKDSEILTPQKNWNFPKNHMHAHVYEDIRRKGVTKNYNTKYSESMHGPLKVSYQLRSNFKEPEAQV